MLLPMLMLVLSACAQPPEDRPHLSEPAFDQKVAQTISFSVPVIGVQQLKAARDSFILLDAREREEYEVSHIPGARFVGYNDFDPAAVADLDKDAPIVLYCSIGYRSEKVGKRLQDLGFTNVQNLYGSIFEWVNQGYEVVKANGKTTNKVHTYNKNWSRWVDPAKAERIW